ncbi:hypothetical protein LCGC14_0383200 [marine sediment metagenome]|uniref:Uncharacterized protein n=1 Tax=marine sediment metagenome TaxID=412755 RepID=A0A0F9VNU8_9ZZZZ
MPREIEVKIVGLVKVEVSSKRTVYTITAVVETDGCDGYIGIEMSRFTLGNACLTQEVIDGK